METRRQLALAGVVAQVVFVGGWVIGGLLEGHGYSWVRHDISDLAALTAHHAWLARTTLAVSGAGTVAFALGALRPALARGDHRSLAPWLIAFSLPAVDNLSDVFFRLDCRAADAGCTMSRAAASWHGTVHVAVFFVAVVPTLAAPFVLARALRRTDGWRELAAAAQVFGVLTVVGLAAAIALSDTAVAGLAQRVIAAIVASGIAALAWQTARRAAATTPSSVRGGGEIPSTARNLAPTS